MKHEIATMDASDLAMRYASGALSPVEVARDVLARIDVAEPRINAFVLRDDAVTQAMAAASEARWKAGAPLSILDGVPITIKDNLTVAGWPTRRGSVLASAATETDDSPVAARMRAAGAVFLGKTTMPEYGWKGVGDSPLTGITRNPWNLELGPGGSSAGAAACAALNLGCIHLGTDGAGSVRIPAAFTGVVGLKPTYGRVPAFPVSSMGLLAHVGPLARTVRDVATAMNIIARPDARDMTATMAEIADYCERLEGGVKGLKIGFVPSFGGVGEIDPEIAALTKAAAVVFAGLGAHVEQVELDMADALAPLMTIWSAGAALALKGMSEDDLARMDPGLVAVAREGMQVPGADYVQALLIQRNALAARMAAFHACHDLMLTPALPLPAFEAGRLTPAHGRYGSDWTSWTPFSYPFNLTQAPAISVPSGLTRAGLPAGLQIVGAFGQDKLVLRAAAAFEAAQPFARVSMATLS